MRQIILDTETTGLHPNKGDRVVEIGAIEIVNRRLTGHSYHSYVNPERDIEEESYNIHGLSYEFLSDKSMFYQLVDEFIEFIKGSELIMHNASFDASFLNNELKLIEHPQSLDSYVSQITDTIALAKQRFPNLKSYSLDGLCKHFNIDNSSREKHSALLDSQLLFQVYLALTSEQSTFSFDALAEGGAADQLDQRIIEQLAVVKLSENELKNHSKMLDYIDENTNEIDSKSLWRQLEE